MKYYIDKWGDWRNEISQQKFYSLKRRKNAHITMVGSGYDKLLGYVIKFY